jgi:hypothetical protein
LRKFAGFATLFAFALLASLASAQQGDVALGFGTVMAPGAAGCNPTTGCPEKGGLYPSVGVDVIFHRRIGFGYDVSWRGGVGAYGNSGGQPYRPILNDFNAVFQPRLGKKVGADLFGGIGWQDTRYYSFQNTSNCIYFGACFSSSDHFLVDVGGGLRYYFWHHVFIRPEAHYYWIHNNTADFNSGNIVRIGASIGYTIGGPD